MGRRSINLKWVRLAAFATGLAVVASGVAAVPAQSAPPLSARGTVLLSPMAEVESGPLEAVPMPELSTETSTTRMLPSGEYELDVATAPVNFLDDQGEWAPIDTDLVEPTADSDSPEAPAEEYAAENAAATYTASIPADASQTPARFAVDDIAGVPAGEAWASLQMEGLTGAPAIEGDTATFTDVEGADAVQLQATGEGLKETIVLDAAPAAADLGDSAGDAGGGGEGLEYRYELTTSEGITPRLTPEGTVDFVRDSSPQAAPVFSIPVGNMYDSAETVAVDGATAAGPAYTNAVTYDLARSQTTEGDPGWELVVTPDASWLGDPERVYPVMIDPTITTGPVRDCSLYEDQPTSSRCGDNQVNLRVGRVGNGDSRRAILDFDISAIPTAAQIDHANLELWLEPEQTTQTTEAPYVVQRTGKAFNGAANWQSSGSNGAWTGGNPTGPEWGLNRLSGTAEEPGWRFFNITGIAEAWHKGPGNGGAPNNGVVLKQRFETITNQVTFLSSSSQNPASRRPNLNVLYTPAVDALAGDRGYWEFEERKLTDRITAKTNIGNGNLLLTAQDASLAGVAGWDMALTRNYNSALAQTGATSNMGAGWSHNFGGAIRLEFPRGAGDRSRLQFWGPTGYRVFFNQVGGADSTSNDYDREEPGINADLRLNQQSNRYELEFFDESLYLFDRDGQLQSMRDRNGNALAFAYRPADNRLASVTDTRGRVAEFTYNAGGLITAVAIRRPEGQDGVPGGVMMQWEYTYSQPAGQIAQMTSSRLAAYDNAAAGGTTEDGNVEDGGTVGAQTTYEYAANGRLTQVRDARENAETMNGAGPGGTTQFTYDGNTNRVRTMRRLTDNGDVPDSETTFTYFPNPDPGPGRTCTPDDDAASFRTHVDGERTEFPSTSEDVTKYCVDVHGRVLRTVDARDNVRSTSWTANSNVQSADMSGTGSGIENHDFSYDEEDNPTTSTSPEGSTSGATYDDPGRLHSPTSTSDDQGNRWDYTYDSQNNLIQVRSDFPDEARDVEYRYCWTGSGQINRIDPVTATGARTLSTDPVKDLPENPANDPRCRAEAAQGNDTLFSYNTAGELTEVDRPAGGDQTYTYDNLSRIRTATDGRGVTTTYTYDALDRVIRTVHSRDGEADETVEWDYDLAGNLVAMNDLNGVNEFGYDELNRKVTENAQDPSGATTFAYDPVGNVRTVSVEGEPNPTRFGYDNLNRVTDLIDQRGGQALTRFEYDQRDNRTRTIFPILNADGQAVGNDLVQKTSYDADSQVKCTYSFRQNNAPNIDNTRISRECPSPTFEGLITYRGYDYDQDGERTATKQGMVEIGNRQTEFTYDAIKRLTSATTGPENSPLREFVYGYDRHSNLVDERAGGTTPGLETGRLQMAHNVGDEICASIRQPGDAALDCAGSIAGQTSYDHDADGNMLTATGGGADSLNGLELTYNLHGQTNSITAPGATNPVDQAYDGVMQDRRTASGDTDMSYGYSGLSAQATGGTSPSSHLFVRDPAGDLIAMLGRDPATGDITDADYYLTDDQKSVLATHDGGGDLTGDGLTRYLYEPYGQLIRTWTQPEAGTAGSDGAENPNATAPEADPNPFTYVSGYYDRDTGFIKFGTRYYMPDLATWTQADSEKGTPAKPLTLNLYGYSLSDPINRIDPSGRLSVDTALLAIDVALLIITVIDAISNDSTPLEDGVAFLIGEVGDDLIELGCEVGFAIYSGGALAAAAGPLCGILGTLAGTIIGGIAGELL